MSVFKNIFDKTDKLPIAFALDVEDFNKRIDFFNLFYEKVFCSKINPLFQHSLINTSRSIFDAKLNDIPYTMKKYKDNYKNKFGSVTLSPYCGYSALKEFTDDSDIFSFIWTLSSDTSANVWQCQVIEGLFKSDILDPSTEQNVGLVVPATNIDFVSKVRNMFPNRLLLIPGVTKQGGSISDVKNAIGIDNVLFVVGRRLIESSDPLFELDKIKSELY